MGDEPIDLAAERNRRAQPDLEFIRTDDYGRKLYTFLLSYEMDGRMWSTQVWAYDFADAETRVKAMRDSLKVDGQAFSTVPA
jgi:hypothetical protein